MKYGEQHWQAKSLGKVHRGGPDNPTAIKSDRYMMLCARVFERFWITPMDNDRGKPCRECATKWAKMQEEAKCQPEN
jgi:hypothetical protein